MTNKIKERKITITIRSDINVKDALYYVSSVVKNGRISKDGKSYCYCTVFGDNIVVLANNRKNDTFIIQNSR